MVVKLDLEQSSSDAGLGVCTLILKHREGERLGSYGSFKGYARYADRPDPKNPLVWWDWTNPDEPLTEVTFAPSIILEPDGEQEFHIFVRNGEVEHCNDCQCGCQT